MPRTKALLHIIPFIERMPEYFTARDFAMKHPRLNENQRRGLLNSALKNKLIEKYAIGHYHKLDY